MDQFEETFTLCHDETERISFIEKLLHLARDSSGKVTIVVALRADFYSHCAQYPLLRQAVAAKQEYIGQMNAEELRRAIEEPAKRGGWEFERSLVDVLLNDIGAQGTGEPEPGALPLLSHALLATWEHRRGHTLTLDGYHASGGVRGAVAATLAIMVGGDKAVADRCDPLLALMGKRFYVGSLGSGHAAKVLNNYVSAAGLAAAAGAEGPYGLTVMFEERFNRWDRCENPSMTGSTTIDTTRATTYMSGS